jgi:CheY-like chemotaxis protein
MLTRLQRVGLRHYEYEVTGWELSMKPETTSSKDILLVEDDPGDVELTLGALEKSHLTNRVLVMENGEEALDYLYRRGKFEMRATGEPIVVFLDNKMPKVNGLEVLKTIKADEYLKVIPVVALTSSLERSDLIAFYKHGVNAYVVKPLEYAEFIEVIKHLAMFWAGINEPPRF